MEKEVNNKKQIIIIVTLTLVAIALFAGLTYAYFTWISKSGEKKITTGNLEVIYTEDESVLNVSNNTTPILDEEYEEKASSLNFKLKNTSDYDITSIIKMNVTYKDGIDEEETIQDSAKTSDYRWALKRGNEKISTGTFADGDDTIVIASGEKLGKKDGGTSNEQSYTLYVWVSETWEDQASLKQSGLTISIETESMNTDNETFARKLITDSNIVKSTDTNLGYPTYYYKGSNVDNYVKFGLYSSGGSYTYKKLDTESTKFSYTANTDILWRIVRVNEDQTVRLISENVTSNSDTYANSETNLETFFNTHLRNRTYMISTQNYCTDDYYISLDRIKQNSPGFQCINQTSNYKKYGSITLDELAFSGVYYDASFGTSSSYINNGSWFYTTSNNSMLDPVTNLIVNPETLSNAATRIVISIKANTLVRSGSGTAEDPWILQL